MIAAFALTIAVQVTAPEGPIDYRQIDIPAAYRGKWALDKQFCSVTGPAVIVIDARRFDRGEEHGLLDIANLNYASDVPELHGRFHMVEGLRFWDQTVRLRIEADRLFVTRTEDPDKPDSDVPWVRCG